VLRHDQVAWRVDANIGGANPSLGTGNVSSYTEITNGSLALVNNSGPGVIPAQIPCSGNNPPTGLTCSAGNESVGVSFNLPAAGSVTACATFFHEIGAAPASSVSSEFQIVETPNNAQTILQEAKSFTQTYHNITGSIGVPHKACGTFSFTSSGQKTLRLMYKQAVVGSPNYSFINFSKWEVYPFNTYQPAPLLIGSVISGSSGIERVERATIAGSTIATACTTSPCNVYQASSPWISSVVRTGFGFYTINFTAGVFSGPPVCVGNADFPGNRPLLAFFVPDTSSSSSINLSVFDAVAPAQFRDAVVTVQCQGPR
jgi:hypothetical protein